MDFWLKIELIKRLVPNPKIEIINNEKIIWNDTRAMPTDSELLAELDKYNKEIKENVLYEKISKLADRKTIEAKKYIMGNFVTDEQIYRYEIKYEMAKKYLKYNTHFEKLSWEADLLNISTDELAKSIVRKGKIYRKEMRKYVALIEAIRVKLNQLVKENKYDSVEKIIPILYKLPITSTTIDEIKKIFKDNDGL